MKTIKTLVDYTKSKKKYQLEKKDYFYIEPIKDIEEYIRNEKSVAGIGLALDFISSWFHYNYIYSFLTTTDSATTDLSSLAKSTLLGIEANNWDFFLGKNHENIIVLYLPKCYQTSFTGFTLRLGHISYKLWQTFNQYALW